MAPPKPTHATEAVWELAEHRFLFIVEDAKGAGEAIDRDTDGNEAMKEGSAPSRRSYQGFAVS
jgi:hypothetical protein